VPAPGQEPSPARIADLVAAIKAAGVSAVFSEAQFPTQVVAQIAAATGATVEASIYTDALGDPPIDSYLGLLRWDIDHVAGALGG
jgi:ABC-type Zn uptake system ZnuABC Zn-binding protein ZnuA